jgi:tetratricopeptide (TPR) repeat protein
MERLYSIELKDTLGRWFRTGSLYIWAGILLAISLACAFSGQAMFNLLGYEFSVLISLVLSQVIAWFSAKEAQHLHKGIEIKKFKDREFAQAMFARSMGMSIVLLFLALIPLTVLALNALNVVNCNIHQGFLFYILIPIVTGWVSMMLSMAFTLFSGGNARRGYFLFLLYTILTILVTTWKLYSGPRVTFFNFLFGAVVLFNYNQVVSIDKSFLLSRSIVIAFGMFAFLCAVLGYNRNRMLVNLSALFKSVFTSPERLLIGSINFLLVVYLVVIFIYRGPLGVDISTSYLNSIMDGELPGIGVTIRYPSDSVIAGDMDRVLKEHEWHYQRIVEELQLKNPPHIRCYVYPSKYEKSRLTGVGGSVFAKPWQAQIHVEYADGDIGALKHELTHILVGEMGRPIIKISLQTGLCEGLSEASEWNAGALTHHQWAQSLLKGNLDHRASPIYTMTNTGFWSQRITVAYYISGSFVRWLIDTYGLDKFKLLFKKVGFTFSDKPYQTVYGKSLRELTEEWIAFLNTVPPADAGAQIAQFMFQRPGFSEQQCSHEVAELSEKAQNSLQSGQYKKALTEFDALMKFQPDDPYHGWGKISAYERLEMYDQALNLATELMSHKESNDGFKAQLLWRRANILAKQERWFDCRKEVDKTLQASLYDWMKRDCLIKLAILDHPSEELRRVMFKGMDSDTTDPNFYFQKALTYDSDFWCAYYMIGRMLRINGEYKESVTYLKQFLALGGYDPMFRKEGDMTLIESAFRSEQYELAYLWADSALTKGYKLSEAEKVTINRWKDRIEWAWVNLGRKVIELNMIQLGSEPDQTKKLSDETPTVSDEKKDDKAVKMLPLKQ